MEADTLNGVCPYFTMFPLAFPRGILRHHSRPRDIVLDPFCGRGTTVHAAHRLGRTAIGFDAHPVAVAITAGKLCPATPADIVAAARECLRDVQRARDVPHGEFWDRAYDSRVLAKLCRLRASLLRDSSTGARPALRAVLLGALHGPRPKTTPPSYFSNQCQRTYAPKPAYAAAYWQRWGLRPPRLDVLDLIRRRSERFYRVPPNRVTGATVRLTDSRRPQAFEDLTRRLGRSVRWIITSPPYYGMRTYRPDQWLRLWFVGGPSEVDYSNDFAGQLAHRSPGVFASQLRAVWRNCALASDSSTRMVVRFGAIHDRQTDAVRLLRESMLGTPWRLNEVTPAGSAALGRRQALHFGAHASENPLGEHDFWLAL